MYLNKLFEEAGKIVTFKSLLPFFIILSIIGAVLIFSKVINSKMPNKEFYAVELIGKVNDISHKPKSTYFQIGSKWYLMKDECIINIAKNDSICKMKNSYLLKVYDEYSRIKWQGEVNSLIFKKVNILAE
jgi:hypothetical protein